MGFREIVKGIGNCISGKYDQEVIDKVIFWDKDKQTGNEVYLQEIERIEKLCGENEKEKIENVKRNILKGIEGERQTKRKLGYCDFYCNILHDIKLSDGDLENQIDFLVITKKMCFIIECKNRSGKVKILKDGRFSTQRIFMPLFRINCILRLQERQRQNLYMNVLLLRNRRWG